MAQPACPRSYRGAALGAAGLALSSVNTHAAMVKGAAKVNIRQDGRYDTVPLTQETVRLHVMQTRVQPVDASSAKSAEAGRKANVEHMLKLLQNAQEWTPPGDIVFFHEFPITGFKFDWSRNDIDRIAIDLPGPESATISVAAKKYGCYVVFGSYARDPDWPGHVLSITTVMGPDGSIVDKHWKARNIMGLFRIGRQPIELMTTTIYNVLDRYIEMYGADAVIPVTRTPYGNICTSSVQREPELFRAMTMKGAEILLRTARQPAASRQRISRCVQLTTASTRRFATTPSARATSSLKTRAAVAARSMMSLVERLPAHAANTSNWFRR